MGPAAGSTPTPWVSLLAGCAAMTEATAKAAASIDAAGGALVVVTSHDAGRNAVVMLFPDRIERVKARAFGSLSKASQAPR